MRLTAIFSLLLHVVLAQTPEVPHKMNFAGMTLTIRDDARREIQKDVDALTQYPKYFNIKVDRAKTYFPIIEKIFAEERLPDDFKYLVIQESALIPDAVSVSNAVGFWQFKDFTAAEMGLRVDKEIDERMNIVSSTRAAAQYLKKNNTFFNNWLYALQAYQMGAGGVQRSVKDYESGTKHMEITSQTYWYVKKFLAHKIAFEGAVKGHGEIKVIAFENSSPKSLAALAKEVSVEEEILLEYNKWARKGTIPGDRNYVVSIPVKGEAQPVYASVEKINTGHGKHDPHKKLDAKPALASHTDKKTINGIPAIKAQAGENAVTLTKRAGVGLSFFLVCNDLSISDPLVEGQYYYLKRKKSKTQIASHVIKQSDETLWSVSQQYGIQLKRLAKLNPGLPASSLKPGTLVVLSGAPKSAGAEPVIANTVEVETGEFFSWSVNPTASISKSEVWPAVVSPEPEKREEEQVIANVVVPVPGSAETAPAKVDESVAIAQPESLPTQHIVVAGETLYAISKRYGLGVMDIVNWNQLKMEDGIKPGQTLMLQDPVQTKSLMDTEKQGEFMIYEVKPSDTLYSVARKYGVTIKDLMDWNQKKDFSVATGEKLKIQVK
ncbi:MAG TPA: LysM peptidoglycan-binding domain-containing protein [Cyclobacteriaceae bacterium]|nr:LysM peptidoglycan-binding domain-containing protein [Cyclobacteriaceae bacterium]HRJ80907.1 LysM peptidoglycan-binding domain-containing protein [Cyclobacteriaceae bacterium]